jgi:hypothetical protein
VFQISDAMEGRRAVGKVRLMVCVVKSFDGADGWTGDCSIEAMLAAFVVVASAPLVDNNRDVYRSPGAISHCQIEPVHT